MKVKLTKNMKKILQDPEARLSLQHALAEGGGREFIVGSHRYKLVPLSSRDLPVKLAPNTP